MKTDKQIKDIAPLIGLLKMEADRWSGSGTFRRLPEESRAGPATERAAGAPTSHPAGPDAGTDRRLAFYLGSGLIDYSQKMTIAAMQIADMNCVSASVVAGTSPVRKSRGTHRDTG